MATFEAINDRRTEVELVVAGSSKARLKPGDHPTLSAPEGELWEARDNGAIVGDYQVSPRVPRWVIRPFRVGLPVKLPPVEAGSYNESLQPSTDLAFLPSTGTLKAVMLFVDFADVQAAGQPWADEKDIVARVVGDAAKEIAETSFGALALTVDPQIGWRHLSKNVKHYTDSGCSCVAGKMRPFIQDAVGLYPKVDFSGYDIVYIVAAKSDDFANSPAWNAGENKVITTPSGEVRHAVPFGLDSYDPINETFLLVHETYHLLGLPDLYDGGAVSGLGYSDAGLAEWDLMANQEGDSRLLGWHRLKLGWLHLSQVVCFYDFGSLEVELEDWSGPDGVKAVMVPIYQSVPERANLAYLVEVARPRCGGASPGVLVYSVNTALPTWERPIQMRGGVDALSAKPIPVGFTYTHLSGIEVEVLDRLPSGGFRVRVEKRY